MKIMEACFLSSNSFTKTLDLVPSSVKVRIAPKRKPALGCVTYCRLGSFSSPDDESTPMINADWRTFRARLVAGESSTRPEEASTCTNPDSDESQSHSSDNVWIGEKWAHSLHEPERGCLLIATEKLDGVHIFERTVILVLFTNPIGPTGVILNRPSLMSIREIGSKVLDVEDIFTDSPLYFGGPLEEGLFLLSPKEGDSGVEKSGVFEEVMKGMYYGSKESVGCAAEMVKRDVVSAEDFRFFDGYCGWEKEQLKDEIRAGYWTVAACSPSVIGLNNVGSVGLWEEILGLMGRRKVV